MSMNFEKSLTDLDKSFIKKLMGNDIAAIDDQVVLFNSNIIEQSKMKKIAIQTNQPVCVEINELDEIKKLSDGTEYKVTKDGWKKI